MRQWSAEQIPSQSGRTAMVTGANSGTGFETALVLAHLGARVVLACRDAGRANRAAEAIRAQRPPGSVVIGRLDLSDLESVARFATDFLANHDRLDLLVNNAGVMTSPLTRTAQGFELQFGTNHLGHFALTGWLLPLLLRTPRARITIVTSLSQHIGRICFDDLNWHHRRYHRLAAYGQSKLANVLFTLELQRRLTANGSRVRATAAHPGWTATHLLRGWGRLISNVISPLLAMPPHTGALPILRAATDPDAAGGSLWAPRYLFELRGPAVPGRIATRAQDAAVAQRLWTESVRLTDVSFDALPATQEGS